MNDISNILDLSPLEKAILQLELSLGYLDSAWPNHQAVFRFGPGRNHRDTSRDLAHSRTEGRLHRV